MSRIERATYAAAITTRMRLGSAVLLTAMRDPVQLIARVSDSGTGDQCQETDG